MGDHMNRINRRKFLVAATAGGITLSVSPQLLAMSRASSKKPNILFIMADDLGYADLSCYGQPNFKTPRLDQLAGQGVMLTQGYANSAVCSATRTALITGRYQYRLPVGLEEPVANMMQLSLPTGHPTIASLLKQQGYRTALIGKWHLGDVAETGPTQYGYDHFFGIATGAADYFTHRIDPSGSSPEDGLYNDRQKIQRGGYLTDLLGEETNKFIEQRSTQPFFISLHFNAPHWPWEAPEDEALSRTFKSVQDLRHLDGGNLTTYAKMVRSMDANIGRVLDTLDKHGLADNTIVVFTSDNGGERFSDAWPLVGVKGELLEGGMRVPLIVRWPNHIKPGSRSDQVMISMDFLPTLVAAAGGAPDPAFPSDGENLLPVLLGQAAPHARKLYWRFKANEQSALRDGDWKYLLIGGHEYLFNLAQDVRERANLKDKQPGLFAQLKADYAAWDKTMLPYPANSYSEDVKKFYSDRY